MREGRTAAGSFEAGDGRDSDARAVAGAGLDASSALALLENDCDWLWESDAEHRISYLSESYFGVTGIDPGRVLGRSRLEMLLRAGRQDGGGSTHFDDLAAHRPFRDFAYEVREGSQTCRWVSVSGVPRFDAEGHFLGYRGTGRNVTALFATLEETRRQLSLHENRDRLLSDEQAGASHAERLMSGLDAMRDAFCYYDADDRLVLFNESMVTMYAGLEDVIRPGCTFEQLVEAGLERDLWLTGDLGRDGFLAHVLDKRRNEPRSESLIAFRDGRWVMHREMRVSDGGVISICTDITAIKQNEQGLEMARAEAEETRLRLQSAIDALEDGFVLWDHDDRLLAFNQAFARQFSFLPGLRPGRSIRDLFLEFARTGVVEEARGCEEEWVERHLEARQNDLGKEIEFQTHDGRWMMRRDLLTASGDRVGIRTDITDYKRREYELADAKQQAEMVLHDLKRSLDSMSMGVVILDAGLIIEIVNRAFFDIWNVAPEEVSVGSPFRALMDANRHNGVYDVADAEWEAYVSSRTDEIRRGDVQPREFARADGRTMIYSVTALSGGKRLISYYDISALKERETQLEDALEQAKLAKAVIDSVPNPMFVKDAQLNFVMANQAFADFFGQESDDMLGRQASDFIDSDEAAAFEESERRVLETGEIYEAEEDFEFEGVSRSRLLRKNRVRTSSGKDYVAGSIFDVTEMRRRETESQEARTYLAAVLESLPAGIIIYDSEDRFVLANRKLQETLPGLAPAWQKGRSFADAVKLAHGLGYFRTSGDPAVDALYDEDYEAWEKAYLERHRLPYSTFERRNPDGRWYQAIDTRMPDGSFIGIRIEITDLKEREEELQEAQRKAVLADRAKSEFLANMSHEIRTPMNGVLGMAELLARSELDERQKTFTDIIVKSGNALLTIINDILDFSKIDAGQLVLDPAPFHLAEAIEDVATLVSTRAKEKDLELIVRVQPGLHDHYVGDVGRIRQIITNLLGNAVKFTDAGHVLVDVTGEANGEETILHVSVTDTGIGIPQDKLQHVFDKFSQVDASSTRRHEGTGLGLAITSRLVAMMGGEMGVNSREGEGSTFWFTIKLPRTGTSGKERTMPIDVTGARILVIDDNAVNRAILLEQMESWGFDACAAQSGPEGIAVMKAVAAHGLSLDCVILDYQMPGMTGAEVARIMRATPEIADTPIVMLTSVDQTLGQPGYRSLNIEAHLIKPARSSALLEALVSAIQRRRVRAGGLVAERPVPAPAPQPETPAPARPELRISPRGGGGAHRVDILVAEDNEVNQLVFTQILGETGLAYEIVGNGRLAVEAHRTMNPRMILMDVSMPEMNGLEATAKIREAEALSGGHVPIIGVTAHALKGDRERCIEAGMDDYLSKPISPEALTRKIRRWMEGEAETGRIAG